MARFCAECGIERPADVAICPSCGAAFPEASSAPASQAAPEPASPARRRLPRRRTLIIAAVALVLALVAAFLLLRGRAGAADDEIALYDFELFPVWVGGRCGYVDSRTGQTRIDPQFEKAGPFTAAGFARVQVAGRWGVIDRTGRLTANPQFESLLDIGGPGLFAARVGDRVGVIDRTGRMIVNPQYEAIWPYDADGLSAVVQDGKVGIIDTTGRVVLPPLHYSALGRWDPDDVRGPVARYFTEGLMVVRDEEAGLGYIDRAGRWVINPQFGDARPFDGSGLAVAAPRPVANDQSPRRKGYIDRSGRFVIPPQFEEALPFNGAPMAPVRVGDRWGYVDRAGILRITPQFARADSFRNESGDWLAVVEASDRTAGFIGTDGAYRIPPQIRGVALPFDRNGRSIVALGPNGAFGLIDTSGRYIVNPTFNRIIAMPGRPEYLYVRFPPGWNNFAPRQGNIEFGVIDMYGRILSSFRGDSCE